MDEDEERRKRRREKNKVAAARCRNKKKERTDFLQRVGSWLSTRVRTGWTYLCCTFNPVSPDEWCFPNLFIEPSSSGVGASGNGELRAEGPDRGAPFGEAAADGDAQPPQAHVHRADRQRQNARERGQPTAGAAGRRNQMKTGKPGTRSLWSPNQDCCVWCSNEHFTGNTILNKHLSSTIGDFCPKILRLWARPQYCYMSWLCPAEDWKHLLCLPGRYFNLLHIKGPMEAGGVAGDRPEETH